MSRGRKVALPKRMFSCVALFFGKEVIDCTGYSVNVFDLIETLI